MSAVANMNCSVQVNDEFKHLRRQWLWLFLFGILLAVCGTAAVIFPALSVLTTFVAMTVLGVVLMIAGIATIVMAFWAGKWSGVLVQFLVGILYLVVGFVITDMPGATAILLALFIGAFFIVVGVFRSVAALVIQFPHWGWALLNGVITFLLGVIIYRLHEQFSESMIWVLGLLIGIEMLFNGLTWIMLSLAVRKIPEEAV